MKKIAGLFAALLFAATGVQAEEPAAPLSRFSLGAHLSYWNARDLDHLDLDGAIGGGVIGQIRLFKHLALELHMGGYGAGSSEEVYLAGEGWYENETVIVCMPLEAGLVAFLPLGDTFSLFGGPGVGRYFFDGEFRRRQGPVETTIDMDLGEETGFYALLGARAQLARNAALFFEGQYTWVETSLAHAVGPFEASQDLDFSGLSFSAGMLFTF